MLAKTREKLHQCKSEYISVCAYINENLKLTEPSDLLEEWTETPAWVNGGS